MYCPYQKRVSGHFETFALNVPQITKGIIGIPYYPPPFPSPTFHSSASVFSYFWVTGDFQTSKSNVQKWSFKNSKMSEVHQIHGTIVQEFWVTCTCHFETSTLKDSKMSMYTKRSKVLRYHISTESIVLFRFAL